MRGVTLSFLSLTISNSRFVNMAANRDIMLSFKHDKFADALTISFKFAWQ